MSKITILKTILYAFLASSTLYASIPGTDFNCKKFPPQPNICDNPLGPPKCLRGKCKHGEAPCPTFLYAFNSAFPVTLVPVTINSPIEPVGGFSYDTGDNIKFDIIGKTHGPISAVPLGTGTSFVFGESGTFFVTVVVYKVGGVAHAGAAPIPVFGGSIQARINDQTLSSLPETPISFSGEVITLQFIHTIKACEVLTITAAEPITVSADAASCNINIIKLQ